jgi:MSHA biogenesis protein MshJ
MNAFKQTIANKWTTLNSRERWMVFFAGLAVIYAVLNAVLLAPLQKQQQTVKTEMTQSGTQLADMKQQITELGQHPVLNADDTNTQKIAEFKSKILAQQTEMAALQDTLVNPAQMPALLKELIAHHESLRLVDMKTMPPENFLSREVNAQTPTDQAADGKVSAYKTPLIYRHAITFTLAGNYMELMRYAQALQDMSSQVLWDKAVLTAKTYPENELTITVYTLSLDATWLSI